MSSRRRGPRRTTFLFLPPVPSPVSLHYRNKAVFHAQSGADGIVRAGYLGDDNRTVVDIPSCPLADEAIENYNLANY